MHLMYSLCKGCMELNLLIFQRGHVPEDFINLYSAGVGITVIQAYIHGRCRGTSVIINLCKNSYIIILFRVLRCHHDRTVDNKVGLLRKGRYPFSKVIVVFHGLGYGIQRIGNNFYVVVAKIKCHPGVYCI